MCHNRKVNRIVMSCLAVMSPRSLVLVPQWRCSFVSITVPTIPLIYTCIWCSYHSIWRPFYYHIRLLWLGRTVRATISIQANIAICSAARADYRRNTSALHCIEFGTRTTTVSTPIASLRLLVTAIPK